MNLFDRLGSIAKNVGDMTNEMFEINRLNAMINTKRNQISERKNQIGDLYWGRYCNGEDVGPAAEELCGEISQLQTEILGLQEAIAAIKEAQRLRSSCPHCGAQLPPDATFCQNCGRKIERDEQKNVCEACGARLVEGANFCQRCGAEVKAKPTSDVPRCASCGAKLAKGAQYCHSCGAQAPSAQPVEDSSEQNND